MFQLPRLKLSSVRAAAPATAPGTRVYAIGDVHGRHDLLLALLGLIRADNAQRPDADTVVVLLGDLINRGPGACQVLSLVANWPMPDARLIALRGNHEASLLAAWQGSHTASRMMHRMGVKQTLASYDVDVTDYDMWDIEQLTAMIRQHVRPEHIALIESMALSWSCGDYVFVHAGLDASRSLEQQSEATLLWSREKFTAPSGSQTAIVHGHANLLEPANERHRICVDTSAHKTGTLTAVGLEGPARWFLATNS